MTGFQSLTKALDGRFGWPLEELPDDLRGRVVEVFRFRPSWESLSAEQRRALTLQSDFEADPACQETRERIFDLWCQIDETKGKQCITPSDLDSRDRRLAEREQEIERLDADLVRQAFQRWGLGQDVPAPPAVRSIRGLAGADERLVEEILVIVATEKISDYAAAKRVVSRARGGGSEEAKLKRLVGRVKQRRAE